MCEKFAFGEFFFIVPVLPERLGEATVSSARGDASLAENCQLSIVTIINVRPTWA